MTDWVRLWHDMPTDPKWRVIARKSKQPLACVLGVFTMMLTNASANSDARGTLAGWDHEDIGAALDMDGEDVRAIHEAMQGKVLEGDRLSGWEKRQPKREDGTAAQRKAAWKERSEADKNASERIGTQSERIGTQSDAPETETETDTTDKSVVPAQRANRLPKNFIVPQNWLTWAISDRGWSARDTAEEAASFVDFWVAKSGRDATKLDWEATWRNWCRNSRRDAKARHIQPAVPL